MARKFIICLIAAACAGAQLPAHAASPANFAVTGNIQSHCSLGNASGPLVLNTIVPSDGKLDPTLEGRTFPITGIFCDAPSTLRVSATALRLKTPRSSLSSSQSQTINFTATAAGWTPSAASVTTGETNPLGTTNFYTGAAKTQGAAKNGSITVSVTGFAVVGAKGNSSNSAKPVDGAYSATIVVTLAPSA